MKNLIWLASYPKSGNTWVRMFLSAYLLKSNRPLNINKASQITKSDSRPAYYSAIALKHVHSMTQSRLDALRKDVQQCLAAEQTLSRHQRFIKTHSACFNPRNHTPLIWPEFTRAAIYIVRNPLDIVDSFSDHIDANHAKVVKLLNNQQHRIGDNVKLINQYLGSWNHHVTSWLDTTDFPILVIRYEDMVKDSRKSFAELLRFLGLQLNIERFEKALEFCSFENLKVMEHKFGFDELSKNSRGGRFFRNGQVGAWKETLSDELKNTVIRNHGEVMIKLGYQDSEFV